MGFSEIPIDPQRRKASVCLSKAAKQETKASFSPESGLSFLKSLLSLGHQENGPDPGPLCGELSAQQRPAWFPSDLYPSGLQVLAP